MRGPRFFIHAFPPPVGFGHPRFLRFFPVWPAAGDDARFSNLRAVGAFVVSASLAGGVVGNISLLSEAGLPCVFLSPWEELTKAPSPPAVVEVSTGKRVPLHKWRGAGVPSTAGGASLALWVFDTAAGGAYRIVRPVERSAGQQA